MNYVTGFMFSGDFESVALIRKLKPEWQKGKLNGIGGKIELGELSANAMSREFSEETGFVTDPSQWRIFAEIGNAEFHVDFYATHGDVRMLKSVEDERVEVVLTAGINPLRSDLIENLPWLISLAVDSLTDGRPSLARVHYPL